MAETLSIQLEKILDEYDEEVKRVVDKAAATVGRQSVKRLKTTSPRRAGGSYASGWRVKTIKMGGNVCDVVIHNATDYQLTHLLEYGHAIVNKFGTYGRTPAHVHIKPVEEWANKEFQEEVERKLKK